MAKKIGNSKAAFTPKSTSQSSRKKSVKTSSMNKSKRRSFKVYKGQGK